MSSSGDDAADRPLSKQPGGTFVVTSQAGWTGKGLRYGGELEAQYAYRAAREIIRHLPGRRPEQVAVFEKSPGDRPAYHETASPD